MSRAVFQRLDDQVDDFLPRWTQYMDQAGYLASTTAKREDCILSYRWFLEPLLQAVEQGLTPSFGELIGNTGNWAEKIVQTSRRHRSRGVTGEMFIGCFKTLVHAILDMIEDGGESQEQKASAVRLVRLWADAFETIIVRDWTAMSRKEATASLDRANRRLTMEKCKYENILDAISDLVFMLDDRGLVIDANRSARNYFQKDPSGVPIWTLLGLKQESMEAFLEHYTQNTPREISLDDVLYFQCLFAPLEEVSLSADGYLVILNDISSHVKQREILEATVADRTAALQVEKSQLQDMNVTLRMVMKAIGKEQEAFQERVGGVVRTNLLPVLDTLRKERSQSTRNSYLDLLEDQLLKLTTGGERDRRALLLKLTPMEMKICKFVQAGASTKNIADTLNLSTVTIQTHRRNIRRKLDLQNRNVNLYTFLNHVN